MKDGKKVKKVIKEEVLLSAPNLITLSRLVLAFVIVYMIFNDYSGLIIAIVFGIGALSDALDGFVARRFNQTTRIGARLDQVIDRIFYGIVVIALVFWALEAEVVDNKFLLMLFMISSREIIGAFGAVIRLVSGKDLYDVKYIGKITCWFQGFALAFVIAEFSFAFYFAVAAGLIGIISGFDYLRSSFL